MTLGPYTLATVIGIIPGALVYLERRLGARRAVSTPARSPTSESSSMRAILLPLVGLALLALAPGRVQAPACREEVAVR